MSCSIYADLREGINPELVFEEQATYLRKVIQRRKILGGHQRLKVVTMHQLLEEVPE